LGASAQENEIVSLGALTEAMSDHAELVYVYFWHDMRGTITGCYEGTARFFDDIEPILAYPKITDGLRWMLRECQRRVFLIKNR
jgi:8-oxo-dGTP diphosphatase